MNEERITKRFHLGDVLSVTTGRLVSSRHMDGIYDILNHLTGDNLFTHQLPRACDECRPYLLARFPILDDPRITTMAVGELALMLESPTVADGDRAPLIVGWLSKLVSGGYGAAVPEWFDLEAMPASYHKTISPLEELRSMLGPEKPILAVEVKGARP